MATTRLILAAIFAGCSTGYVANSDSLSRMKCEYYNATCVREASALGQSDEHCQEEERVCPHASDICYVVWLNATTGRTPHKSGHDVQLMGCMTPSEDHQCYDNEVCQGEPKSTMHYMCCCRQTLCNANFKFAPKPVTVAPSTTLAPSSRRKKSDNDGGSGPFVKLLYGLPLLVVTILIGFGLYIWNKRKAFTALPLVADGEDAAGGGGGGPNIVSGDKSGTPWLPKDANVELKEIKAQGRFGKVWKGRLYDKAVAVKILTEKASWATEIEVYNNLSRMNAHDNILMFMYADQRSQDLGVGVGISQEFWLITEFHERGSLCEFLKTSLISWGDLCKIALSIAKGLTFLHESIPAQGSIGSKPPIAHRDFKSKNVLIKADMTACIADFGLALIFEPGKPVGDRHGQVGTRRYMAPEVLEGAMFFTKDAFQRIDMYACGLVFWELASRCTVGHSSTVDLNTHPVVSEHGLGSPAEEYKLPFEAETNSPTSMEMIVSDFPSLFVKYFIFSLFF